MPKRNLLPMISCGWQLLFLFAAMSQSSQASNRPNIIVIMADDLGWNDVGFHGNDDIPTPNIDALAYNGVILHQHYTAPLCTPSRSAFLTGKHPIRTGMQHLVILENEPWGLSLEEKLLPEYLKEVGYTTRAIGKWHLGFFRKEYTPQYRGFDSHFGYWQGYMDYYNYSCKSQFLEMEGYDLHRGVDAEWRHDNVYATDLFTKEAVSLIKSHRPDQGPLFLYFSHLAVHSGTHVDPFQAPDEEVAKFSHIQDLERRVYAAMVSKLDKSIGEVVTALRTQKMLENSVIVFISDNGGQTYGIHYNRASNYPLRGMKTYPWEGGTRTVAAVWSPLIKRSQAVYNHMVHIVDWLPTLASVAGIDSNSLGDIDGVDLWKHISNGIESPRKEFVYNIDRLEHAYGAVRRGKWKYMEGTPLEEYNDWSGEDGKRTAMKYSVDEVFNSPVGVALEGLSINLAIRDKVHRNPDTGITADSMKYKLLDKHTVLKLRSESQVICNHSLHTVGPACDPLKEACLFNLENDPCEIQNVVSFYPQVTDSMKKLLDKYRKLAVKPRNKKGEEECNPELWNGAFVCWYDEMSRGHTIMGTEITKLAVIITTMMLIILLVILLTIKGDRERRRRLIESIPSDSRSNLETKY